MTPDPDHVQVMARSLHLADCPPDVVPYERYSDDHREEHRRQAHLVLNGLHNAGYTLTTDKGAI